MLQLETKYQLRLLLEHVKNMLMSNGDVIHSRWKKLTQEKRAMVLATASKPSYLFDVDPARSAWNIPINASVLWADIISFSQDSMKLLPLLHARTAFEPQFWAAFDTRSSEHAFAARRQDLYVFNASVQRLLGHHAWRGLRRPGKIRGRLGA
jgi:hypothetical protein